MQRLRNFVLTILLVLGMASAFNALAFIHPGIPLTIDDLNTLKSNFNKEPWKSAYASLVGDSHSSTNYTMQGPFGYVSRNEGGAGYNINLNQWISDMNAIGNQSLLWYFTSNSAYAQKAHDILIAWANTITNYGGFEGSFEVGGDATGYVMGADILRATWPGWTSNDTATVCACFTNVYWKTINIPRTLGSANQGGFSLMGGVAFAVFCDDTNKLNQAIASLTTDAETAFRDTLPNGQVGDYQRDQGHSWNMLIQMAWPAEVLWKQGIDVFFLYDQRILAAVEYYSRYNLPGPTPAFIGFGAPYRSAGSVMQGDPRAASQSRFCMNIVKAAYQRLGVSTPWTTLLNNDEREDAQSFLYRKSADTSTATPLVVTLPTATSLTTGVNSADLNGSTPAGNTTYSNGVWTLKGGFNGGDPWSSTSDTVRFAYKQVTGDFTMIAQVTSIANVGSSAGAKAGIMVRDSLGTATNECYGAFTPGMTYERVVKGWQNMAYGANIAKVSFGIPQTPYWVKIERLGPRIQIFYAPNGADWSPTCVSDWVADSSHTELADTLYVGLFTCSGVTGVPTTATFSNVRITGGDGLEASKVPLAPFSIYAGPGDGQVQLRWNESFGAASYNVKRSFISGGPYTTIATVTNTIYTDTNLLNGVTYYYVVTAANAAGESGNSLEDNTTPQLAMVSVVSGGGATASDASDDAAQAFDINPSSDWFNNNAGTTGWLQYDLGPFVRQTVRRYAITSPNSGSYLSTPSAWQFLGSLDGLNWTLLDTQTNQTFPTTYPMKTYYYDISNNTAYRFYRLNISANNGDVSGLRVGELALLAMPGTGTNLGTTARVWSGAVNGNWDITTVNWQSNGVSGAYQNGGAVLFDDTATANTTINVAATVTPASVIFNNSGNSYTFSGSAIGGATNMQKVGGGTVTLNNANTFPGGISIFAGTVNVGNNAALGTGTVTLNGGTLQNSAGLTGVTNNIAVLSGGGTIDLGINNNMTLTGVLSGSGNLTIAPPGGPLASLYLSFSTNTASGTITIPNSTGNNQIVTRFGTATAGSATAAWSIGGAGDRGTTFDFGTGTISFGSLSGSGLIQGNSSGTHTMSVGALNTDSTFSGTIKDTTGTIALTKVGSGTLRLTGANTYSGQTTVSNGELVVSTAFTGKSSFWVTNGATLGVTNFSSASAVVSNLTVAAGTALEFQNVSSTSTPLILASNVIVGGTCTVKITGPSGLAAGSYPLVNYAGKFTGVFASLQLQLPSGFGGVLVSNANQIALSVTNVPAPSAPATLAAASGNAQVGLSWSTATYASGYWIQRSTTSGSGYALVGSASGTTFTDTTVTNNLTYYYVVTATNNSGISGASPEASATPRQLFVWSGVLNTNWDFATANWANAGVFSNGVTVQFDDTALTNTAVAISSPVTPVLTVVTNTTNSYALTGSAIVGTGLLIKTGSGMLTLGNANTYSGGTSNFAGALVLSASTVGSAGSITSGPLGTGPVTLCGGELSPDNGASRTLANTIIVTSNTVSSLGSTAAGKSLTLTGPLIGGGTLVNDGYGPAAYSVFFQGNLSGFTGTLAYTGPFGGSGGGYWRMGTSGSTVNLTNATVTLNGGNVRNFGFTDSAANVSLNIGALTGGGYFQGSYWNSGSGNGNTVTVGYLNTDAAFTGQMGLAGNNMANFNVVKMGTGTQWLTGPNVYSGHTTVSNGELVVSTLHAGGGAFTVASGATLGVTDPSFTSAAFGNLTLAANAALEFQRVWSTGKPVVTVTNVTISGSATVKIPDTSSLTIGASYPLISYAGTLSGFANLKLQMPYGWRGTLVTNTAKQILLANVATVATTPTQLNVGGNTGGQLQLNWPPDHTGWRLEMSTNLVNATWSDVSSNLVTATNLFDVPVSGTNGSIFYRLVYP